MKKFLSLTMAAAMALGFAACSNEDIVSPKTTTTDDGNGSYLQFIVTMPASDSRAGDYSDNETSGVYQTGTDTENRVHKVYAYFADANGNLVKMSDNLYYAEYGAVKLSETSVSGDANYITTVKETTESQEAYVTAKERIDANIAINTDYTVYLLCNKPAPINDENGAEITTVDQLLKSKLEFQVAEGDDADTIDENGIPMAARSIDGVISANFKATEANTISNPVVLNYAVERSFARIAYTGLTTVPLYEYASDPTIGDDGSYQASGVYGDPIGNIKILKYYIVNKANQYYTYRHVGTIDETTFKTTLPSDVATLFGPVSDTDTNTNYVIDPHSGDKTNGDTYLDGYWQSFNFAFRHYGKFKSIAESNSESKENFVEYVPENVMATAAQKKGQATGVIFQVQLLPKEVITKDGSKVAYEQKDGKYPDLYYYEAKFYESIEAIQNNLSKEVTSTNYVNYDIKFYQRGLAYYEYFIRHNNNYKYTKMGYMEFAIVRNNSYELAISAAAMTPYTSLVPTTDPENPDPNVDPDNDPDDDPDEGDPDDPYNPEWPDDPFDPEHPDPTYPPIDPDGPNPGNDVESAKMYLRVNVVVRPWIMRTNPTVLGQ